MGVMMGPNGQLINTSNIGGGALGSNLIPNITPNIGALSKIDKPVKNDDGTITLPTIELQTNDPGLEAGQLQNLYGTDLMPYYNWVEAKQTGTMTYDPAEELSEINDDFMEKHGITAQEAAAKLEAEMKQAAIKSAAMATTYGAGKAAQAYLGDPSIGVGGAALEGMKSLNPFKGIGGSPQVAPQAQYGIVGADGVGLDRTFTNITDAKAYTDAFKGTEIKDLGPQKPVQSALQAGKAALQGSKTGFAGFQDRLYGDAAVANLKVTGAAAGLDFITQVAMGADPMDAAKDAGKTAVLSYVANAIIPGSGPIVGFLSKFF